MDFTFGIITAGGCDSYIDEIITTIEKQNVPNYEIIIVGDSQVDRKNTTVIPFDESQKNKWITRKKNIITENARYENIVYQHDYVKYLPGWYEGQLKKGNSFSVRMDKIINYDGTRWRDWILWWENKMDTSRPELSSMDSIVGKDCILPYDIDHLNDYMYISGTYWIGKKDIMLEYPQLEDRVWGQGEDVHWSFKVRKKYKFQMNTNSTVQLMRYKERFWTEPNEQKIQTLRNWK